MDLESECSVSVEENEVRQNESPHDGENGSESNIYRSNGDSSDQKGKLAGLDSEESQRLSATDPPGSSPSTTKGYGLKKWRRIKRDVVKDQNTHIDSSKLLKRGLSGAANSTKAEPFRHDIQQNSEGSIGSSNALKNVGFTAGFAVRGSSSDSRYAVGSAFAVGTDSENSEDRSSKSSTAASAPQSRYDPLGYVKENNQSRNINSSNFANSTPKVQHGKGQIESSKKLRGERGKSRKKNSHCSMDSDSISSNFNRGAVTLTSNGKHSGGPNLYYEGNSGDAHANEHFPDEIQAGYCKENVVEDEDLFQGNLATKFSWDLKEEKSDNELSSTVEDPLADSIRSLQSVQEALAEEVQKFREIGHDYLSPDDDSIKCAPAAADIGSVDPKFHESSLSGQSEEEGTKQTASSFLERKLMSLTENVNNLELKLEETHRTLAVKNSRIAELETSLRNVKFPSLESTTLVHLSEEFTEAEFDVDDIFRQKIESEVECLLITKMIHDLKAEAGFHLKQLEEQEALSGKRANVLLKLIEAEGKASVLKNNQSEELENHHGGNLEVEEPFMMQKRVYKVTFCFWVQFMLLMLAVWLFMSQLAPNGRVVVPT